MDTIEDLKYVILDEWTDDPPAGCVSLYYDIWFEDPDEVRPIIDEIVDHVKDAIGYEEPDDDECEDVDFEDEIEGLDPADEDGNLSLDSISNWSWDNGGSGCGCIAYAEGSDIVETAIDFFEDHFDDIEEVDLEEDDEGNLLIEFPVTVCLGGGDGGDVSVVIPVTKEEFCKLLECCREEEEIATWEGLEELVSRIEEAAKDEAESSANELDDDLDCSEADCIIAYPEDVSDIADEYRKGLTNIEIDLTIEKAKAEPESVDAVIPLLETISKLIENLNDSIW